VAIFEVGAASDFWFFGLFCSLCHSGGARCEGPRGKQAGGDFSEPRGTQQMGRIGEFSWYEHFSSVKTRHCWT
jgi:hypothetical protein